MLDRVRLGILGFILFLAFWEATFRLGILSDRVVAFPSTLARFLSTDPQMPGFGAAVLSSASQLAVGLAIGATAGTALGLLLGWFRRAGTVLEPLMVAVNAVPLIAVVPMMIIILGIGSGTALTVVALFAFFPVFFAVSSAVAAVDAKLVQMCRSYGGGNLAILKDIVLPTTAPALITGLRLAIGRALTGLVVVELFVGQGGLGSTILNAVNRGRPDEALLAVMVLGVINVVASGLLLLLQGRVETWRPAREAGR